MGRAAASRLEDGTYLFHASQYGGCFHSQVLALLGHEPLPPTKDQLELYRKGNDSEVRTKAAMLAAGIPLVHAECELEKQTKVWIEGVTGDEQNGLCKLILQSSLDGLIYVPEGEMVHPQQWIEAGYLTGPTLLGPSLWVWEGKNLGPDKWADFQVPRGFLRLFMRYAFQVSAQAYGVQAWMQLARPPGILFSAENAQLPLWRTGARRMLQVMEPPLSRSACVIRCVECIMEYEHAVATGEIIKCNAPAGWCPYLPPPEKEPIWKRQFNQFMKGTEPVCLPQSS